MGKGQILVATVLMITLIIMVVIVNVYEAHVFFLKTRSIVVREVIASITADFERALAVVLAAATRSYFNYTRFYDFCSRFNSLGLSYGERHNFTVARNVAKMYLQYWMAAASKAYASYGPQIRYELGELNISEYLGRKRSVRDLVKGYWYYPSSASVAYARLKVNLTNAGFYGWESDVIVGVFLKVYPYPLAYNRTGNYTEIMINVRVDNNETYGELLTKGWVEIYYPENSSGRWTGRWLKAKILDVKYEGFGNYSLKFEPYVEILEDPLTGKKYVPLLVVVSDKRGILVESITYSYIPFKIKKNTPDKIPYVDEETLQKTYIYRPIDTPDEKYVIEFSSDLRLFWLDMELNISSDLRLPPLPFMPIKQLRVNISSNGKRDTLRERPLQYENWTEVYWHDRWVQIPVNLPDPTLDIQPYVITPSRQKFIQKYVFLVPFPKVNITYQWVVLWWSDDLDWMPIQWKTDISYVKDLSKSINDLRTPVLWLELIDVDDPYMRDYPFNYRGVAAIGVRDTNDEAFGPWNIHAFGRKSGRLGWYRPCGRWKVLSHYLGKFRGVTAPIRIFAVLDTDRVCSVYAYENKTGYYSTLAILSVVNGTRYVPLIMHVYWSNSKYDYSYWLFSMMGGGRPTKFAYAVGWNGTWYGYPLIEGEVRERKYTYISCWYPYGYIPSNLVDLGESLGCQCYHLGWVNPGLWYVHWNVELGRAIIGNENLVKLLIESNNEGYRPAFYVTRCSGSGIQNSVELKLADGYINVDKNVFNPLLDYWLVLFAYEPGTLDKGWQAMYIFAPMFWKAYAPEVVKP